LQQLEMESNGKSTSREGLPLKHLSAPVVWGALGSNAQHAFNQLLHQGTESLPVDFIVPISGHQQAPEHEQAMLANALAQSAVMLSGHDAADLRDDLIQQGIPEEALESAIAQRSLAGNRSSNMLIYERLDAKTLGSLIALYEHKVFVQGVCWQINSFDQWGVEFGKRVAKDMHRALSGELAVDQFDASTRSLIRYIRGLRNCAHEQ
jgi:glucose-6-phosphate isomerase